jgi:hypothetical protein
LLRFGDPGTPLPTHRNVGFTATMRARGRVEAVSSGRTCWFALRRPVPLSDVVLTKLWGARGADCLLRIVGGQKFVLLLASWSSGSSGSPIVELLPRDLPERRGWKLSWLRLIGERASLRDAASFIPSVWLPLVSTRTCCGASIEVATECLR